jgi:hypothetical protein
VVLSLLGATTADAAGWSVTSVPPPAVGQGALSGVSCPAANACTAVGIAEPEGSATFPLTEGWHGSAWSLEANPANGATGALLYGVSCPVLDDCLAVGAAGPAHADTYAEAWNGSGWSIVPIPSKHSGVFVADALSGISCHSPTACVAVGDMTNSAGTVGKLLAEHWNGTQWTLMQPPGSVHGSFAADSCTAAKACVVVGSVGNPATLGVKPLIERWNGHAWKREPGPASVKKGYLSSISCTSARACTAVGAKAAGPLIVRWNGKHWTLQKAPGAASAGLDAVWCTSARRCAGVGSTPTPGLRAKTLAEAWINGSWTVQATPSLAPKFAELAGVACRGHET